METPRVVGFWFPADAGAWWDDIAEVLRSACTSVGPSDNGAICREKDTTIRLTFDPDGEDVLWVDSAEGPEIVTLAAAIEETLVQTSAVLPLPAGRLDKKLAWVLHWTARGEQDDRVAAGARKVVARWGLVTLSVMNQDFEQAASSRRDAFDAAEELADLLSDARRIGGPSSANPETGRP